jgi:hypothetical protein
LARTTQTSVTEAVDDGSTNLAGEAQITGGARVVRVGVIAFARQQLTSHTLQLI